MDLFVIAIKELGVQILVEIVWLDNLHHSRLARPWRARKPDMRVALRLEEITALMDHRLDLFTIGEVVAWKLMEGFRFFTLLNHTLHLNDDIIQLALLFFITAFRDLGFRRWLVLWQNAILV